MNKNTLQNELDQSHGGWQVGFMLKQTFKNSLLGYFYTEEQATHKIPTICTLNLLYMRGTSHNEEQICGYLSDFKSFDNNLMMIISAVGGRQLCVLLPLVPASASAAE